MAGESSTVYTKSARLVLLCQPLFALALKVFLPYQFVEDLGNIVFYKNAFGLAATKAIHVDRDSNISDSGIELEKSD